MYTQYDVISVARKLASLAESVREANGGAYRSAETLARALRRVAWAGKRESELALELALVAAEASSHPLVSAMGPLIAEMLFVWKCAEGVFHPSALWETPVCEREPLEDVEEWELPEELPL